MDRYEKVLAMCKHKAYNEAFDKFIEYNDMVESISNELSQRLYTAKEKGILEWGIKDICEIQVHKRLRWFVNQETREWCDDNILLIENSRYKTVIKTFKRHFKQYIMKEIHKNLSYILTDAFFYDGTEVLFNKALKSADPRIVEKKKKIPANKEFVKAIMKIQFKKYFTTSTDFLNMIYRLGYIDIDEGSDVFKLYLGE